MRYCKCWEIHNSSRLLPSIVLKSQFKSPSARKYFILGFPCDSQRVGVDYSRLDYAFRINSNINGQTPFQFYTFARARNIAMYSPTGIEVVE